MSSIIINSFYRALTNIDENEGIKNVNVQQLTRLLVDQLYPEDGVLVWENEDTLKIRRTPVVQTVTVPMAPAEPVVAPVVEVKVKEVKVKEPKAKFVGNLEKLNPTQDKLLKKTAADGNVHFAIDTKVKFIAFMNAMDNKDFNSKKMEEHMKAFFAPKAPEVKDEECDPVEYKGKEYWVSKDGTVYETEIQEDGSEIDKKVGKVGLAYFADMVVPVE